MTNKKASLESLQLNGRSITIAKTDANSHFITGSVLQSRNGNQFKIVEHDDIYEVIPVSAKVSPEITYLLVGNLSPEFSQQMIGMKGSEKLSLSRSLGVV